MKLNCIMCVVIGGIFSLSQSFGLYAKSVEDPILGVSTTELDGFVAKTKNVDVYRFTSSMNNAIISQELLRSFRYDSLGRRTLYHDRTSGLIYRYGYDRRGNHVRTSVLCDTIREWMRDTIYSFDSNNRLSKKRISCWGEWLETEDFEYDSFGNLISRKLYSEAGDRSLKRSEIYRYDAKNRMVASVMRDNEKQTSSKTIWIYDKESDRLKGKREEENGIVLHDYKYTYDSKGNLTLEEDNGKLPVRVARTTYQYDSKSRLIQMRKYDQDSVWLAEKAFSYHSNGRVKKDVDLKLHLVPLDKNRSVNEWDRKETIYDRHGKEKKYEHSEGKGELYAAYRNAKYVMLPDKSILPSYLYYDNDYLAKNHIVQSDSDMVRYQREKVYIDRPNYLQKMRFAYKKGLCKRCTAYNGFQKVRLKMKYDKNNQLIDSEIRDIFDHVIFQSKSQYDEKGNILMRYGYYYYVTMNSFTPLFREHLEPGLFDKNIACRIEYWEK